MGRPFIILKDRSNFMKVLFVAQLLKARNFQPLGLEYLSAQLKKAGHETFLADGSFPDKVCAAFEDIKPGLVGYYACTGQHKDIIRVNDKLKRRFEFFAAFGGPHATFFPEMIELPGVDGVCRGEGEEAVTDLVEALDGGRDYCDIPNWSFQDAGCAVHNDVRPLQKNLDEIGPPDWSLCDHISYCRNFPVKIFMASRGCPYSCAFCYNPAYRKIYKGQNIHRTRDPKKFVSEISQRLNERPFSFAYIFDDTFGIDASWASEFCALYKKEIGLPFYVNLRADLMTENLVRDLAEAGLAYAGMGLESGSESVRNRVLCKGVTDAQLKKSAAILRANKVVFTTFNMLGIPDTSLEDDLETWRMNLELRPDFAEALMFQPYPGTVLGDSAVDAGIFSGNPDEVPSNFKGKSILKLPGADQRLRLLYLFPIVAAHPLPAGLLRLILKIPAGSVYRLLSRLYEGAFKILKIYRVSIPKKTFARLVWHYLRY